MSSHHPVTRVGRYLENSDIDDIATFLSALAFFARRNPDTQSAFDSATRALHSLDPDSERLDELQVQVRLLLETATGSAGPE